MTHKDSNIEKSRLHYTNEVGVNVFVRDSICELFIHNNEPVRKVHINIPRRREKPITESAHHQLFIPIFSPHIYLSYNDVGIINNNDYYAVFD